MSTMDPCARVSALQLLEAEVDYDIDTETLHDSFEIKADQSSKPVMQTGFGIFWSMLSSYHDCMPYIKVVVCSLLYMNTDPFNSHMPMTCSVSK